MSNKPSAAILLGGIRYIKSEFGTHMFKAQPKLNVVEIGDMLKSYNKLHNLVRDPLSMAGMSGVIFALNEWRCVKKIYRFDNEFYNSLLTSNFSNFHIPFNTILNRLENGVFIEIKDSKNIGYVYSIEKHGDKTSLIATVIPNNIDRRPTYAGSIIMDLEGKSTVQEAMDDLIAMTLKPLNISLGSDAMDHYRQRFMKCIAPLVYILSNNADIEQDPENVSTFRPMSGLDNMVDKYREVQIFNVGYNIIKDMKVLTEKLNNLHSEGNTKVYIRSGHWRGRNSESDNPILYYVPPTIVYDTSIEDAIDDEEVVVETDRERELRLMVEKLQKEVQNKSKDIDELSRKNAAIEAKYQSLMVSYESNKQELAAIRDILFAQEMGSYYDDQQPTTNNQITFPWYTNKKITVFGGHPTWINKIKPMLPNIRFVDRAQSVNQNLILNSDVIWVQTNAMSHSLYNSIMSIVRQYNKPIKYFKYASSEKCAIQLVEEMTR